MLEAQKSVVARGYLIDFSVPSEALLAMSVNVTAVTDKNEYMKFKEKLEDMLRIMDAEYAKRKIRGRSITATYSTVIYKNKKNRIRVLRFIPYPSRYINELKSLRRRWYDVLEENTVVIGKSSGERKLYLCPQDKALSLTHDKERLNADLEHMRKELRKFEQTKKFQNIFSYISESLQAQVTQKPLNVHDVRLQLLPLQLDQEIVDEYMTAKHKGALDKIERERSKGLQAVQREINNTRREMTEQVINSLQNKLGAVMQNLARMVALNATEKNMTKTRKRINDIKALADGAGVGWTISSMVDASLKTVDALVSRKQSDMKVAAEALAKEAGVAVEADAAETLKNSAVALSTDLSPRLKAVLEQIL